MVRIYEEEVFKCTSKESVRGWLYQTLGEVDVLDQRKIDGR